MSRATISTGDITFNAPQKKHSQVSDDAPMHIAILGDFSGRASRGINDWSHLAERKALLVDRDNFEEVFEKLKVTLGLSVADEPIHFAGFDDLHPDYLYERVALFDELRTLKRKLHNPRSSGEAIEEIQQWARYRRQPDSGAIPPMELSKRPVPENLLDAILAQNEAANRYIDSPAGNINQLIKDIVSPYVTTKADPRLPEFEAAVDDATAELMRKIMHAGHFQALEASWRSLYLLVRRVETSSALKLFLVDVSKDEILSDIRACKSDLRASGLYKLLGGENEIAGGIHYAVINADFFIEDRAEDLLVASLLARIGQAIDATVVAGGSPRFAGCENLASSDDPENWRYRVEEEIQKQWNELRNQSYAAHLALAAPRFLLRLPYGKKTSPIDSFDFDELPDSDFHEYYLWGNSAWLVTMVLAQSYSMYGRESTIVQEVTDLPVHVYFRDDDSAITPSGEVLLTDKAATRMIEVGLLPVRSVKNSTTVLIAGTRSISGEILRGS